VQLLRPNPKHRNLVGCAKAASVPVVAYFAGTVVVKAVAGKERCRQEHELNMTEYVVGAVGAVDQVLEKTSNVDMPEESPASKVGLEYMQDE
jgi:hypothetical protein